MRRPFSVTLLAVAVLLLALFNLLRFTQALDDAYLMIDLHLAAPLAANFSTGAMWGIGFGALSIGLCRLRRWARNGTLIAIVLYHINVWLIRLIFSQSPDEVLTRPVDAAISALSILVVWGVLFLPRVRRAFR